MLSQRHAGIYTDGSASYTTIRAGWGGLFTRTTGMPVGCRVRRRALWVDLLTSSLATQSRTLRVLSRVGLDTIAIHLF